MRDGLVRGWTSVAAPDLQLLVQRELKCEGISLDGADGWVPMAAYLRLHEHIADLDHSGDGRAFAERWLRDVERQVPALARWPLKALGLRRGLDLLQRLWPEAWGTPAPTVRTADESWYIEGFTGLPADNPTFVLLLSLQFELAARLLSGKRAGVLVRSGVAGEMAVVRIAG